MSNPSAMLLVPSPHSLWWIRPIHLAGPVTPPAEGLHVPGSTGSREAVIRKCSARMVTVPPGRARAS
jgi:hypothetical protein